MADQNNVFGDPILWRDTMKSPRLLIFDARIIVFIALLIFHLRVWTALLLVVGVMVFWMIERAGLRFPSALRALRSNLAGPQRPARPAHLYRTTIDYGFEGHPLIKPSAAERAFKAGRRGLRPPK